MPIEKTLGLEITANPKGLAVLHYDTEQSEAQLHKNLGKTLRRASLTAVPEFCHSLYLASLSRKDRLNLIRESMDLFHHRHGGIHLVGIDGIADLIRSANDETESIAIVDELYRLAGAIASKVMMVEPSDSQECKDFTMAAYELSEKFDTPVIVRLSTRIAHSQSAVELGERVVPPTKPYEKNPAKFVMMPGFAKKRHTVVEAKLAEAAKYAETSPLNKVEYNSTEIGIITAGNCYLYAKEALGDKASYLKLGVINPLPIDIIRDFAAKCERVYVIEELDDIIESHCKKNGVDVIGKELFGWEGEISQAIVREKILGEKAETMEFEEPVPVRPPVMCAGCPHRGLFYCLSQLGVYVSGDIGCYTLGATAPLSAMDTTICMGASISALHGYNKALGKEAEKKSVAVIGDSTFMHSGMTGLVNIAYNATNSTVIILDNSITGMTGHQQNPTTGKNLKGDPAAAVNLEDLCHAIGIKSVRVADPYNMAETKKIIEEELAKEEPSVIISRRPCALLKYVKHNPPLKADPEKCVGCKQCLKIGCPAISIHDKKCVINHTQCVGCGICKEMCRLDAIN